MGCRNLKCEMKARCKMRRGERLAGEDEWREENDATESKTTSGVKGERQSRDRHKQKRQAEEDRNGKGNRQRHTCGGIVKKGGHARQAPRGKANR